MILVQLFALLAFKAHALEIVGGDLIQQIGTPSLPAYFFSLSPDGKIVSLNTSDGGYRHTELVDFDTGSTVSTTGQFDPVFATDDLMVILQSSEYHFMRVEDIYKDQMQAQPIYVESAMQGAYQSIGFLGQVGNNTNIRMLVELSAGTHASRDFLIKRKNGHITEVKALTAVEPLCSNHQVKLPQLSAIGDEMAGLTLDGKSVILKINPDRTCDVAVQFNAPFGKMSFSYDHTWIAYHASHNGPADWVNRWIQYPTSDMALDVFVYNRVTGKHYQISKVDKSNAMYPRFTRNNELVFLETPYDTTQEKVFYKVDLSSLR